MEFDVLPEWDQIEEIRLRSQDFVNEERFQKSVAKRLEMIVSELAENAIKYGHFGKGDSIHVELHAYKNGIEVDVTHPTNLEDKVHLIRLDRLIQWIRGFQDPFEAYVERLKVVAALPLEDEESGLGLVRIGYEGGGIIDFYVSDDGRITVSTMMTLN